MRRTGNGDGANDGMTEDDDEWRALPPPAGLPVDDQELIQALRLYMGRTGLSLRAFGRQYQYSPGTVSRYLSGERGVSSAFVRDLLTAVETAGERVRESDRARLENVHRRTLAHPRGAASKSILKSEFAKVSLELAQRAHTLEEVTAQLALSRIEVLDATERIQQLTESLALKEQDIRALEAQMTAAHRCDGTGPQELREMTASYEKARTEAETLRAELAKTRTLLREAEQRLADSERGMAVIAESIGAELRKQDAAHRAEVRELESRVRSLQGAVNRRRDSDDRSSDELDVKVPTDLPIDPRLQIYAVGEALRQLLVHARSPGLNAVSRMSSVPLGEVQRMFIHNEVRDEAKLRAVATQLAERAGRPEAVQQIMDLWQAGAP